MLLYQNQLMLMRKMIAIYAENRNVTCRAVRATKMTSSSSDALCHEGVWGSGCIDPHVLSSALAGGEWSTSRPGRFTPGERAPGTHWIGGCVDPRAGLNDLEKRKFLTLPGLELRPLGRPAYS
jgi:hypothetical protein